MRAATSLGVALVVALTASACERAAQPPSQSPAAPAADTTAKPSAPAFERLALHLRQGADAKARRRHRASKRPQKVFHRTRPSTPYGERSTARMGHRGLLPFRGKKSHTETARTLVARATADATGRLRPRSAIPRRLRRREEVCVANGETTLAQGGLEVRPDLRDDSEEGARRYTIELRVKGLGWRTMESAWW